MTHLALPLGIGAALVGTGLYGMLARRHPLMLMLAVNLVVAGATVILVATAATGGDPTFAGDSLALLLSIIATGLTVLTCGVALLAHRVRGRVDLTDDGPDGTPLARPVDDDTVLPTTPGGHA